MNYTETIEYLTGLGETRMRLDLSDSENLLNLLGRPDRKLKSVIVAGTNGKGSVCAYLTAVSRAAGLRVGTYTSPHLESVNERIAVNGEPISNDLFAESASHVREIVERYGFEGVTYFEFVTMMATVAFVKSECELCLFEVGLGGRLDTTNTLDRIGSVITTIDLDHTAILGNTLSKIATEKGGILRRDAFAVISEQTKEARETLQSITSTLHLQAKWYGVDYQATPLPQSLRGAHQIVNASTAVQTARELRTRGFQISDEAIATGLKNTVHPGRLECLHTQSGGEIWLDVAHNPAAIRALVKFLREEDISSLPVYVGILQDKNWREMLNQLSEIAESFILSRPESSRAWNVSEAEDFLRGKKLKFRSLNPIREVANELSAVKTKAVCTGSFYLVGAVRSLLRG